MQPTNPLPECPPLVSEAIDRILKGSVTNPQALQSRGFLSSLEAAVQNPDPIRNGTPTTLFADGEKPFHRLICYMALGGKTNKAIAEEMNLSEPTVSTILRQPASKDFMAREAKRIAGGQIENLFKAQLHNTFQTLIEMRDDKATPAATRATVCNAILDRALGKPTVYMKSESTITYDEAKAELADLDRQLAALKQQTKATPGAS